MKRWKAEDMLAIGKKIFARIHSRKYHAHHNHDVHFLAREINDWLPAGVQSMIEGRYTPRHLERIYFKDETIDQLHLSDRVLQHILLKQLKPTFKHVMNKHCYHLCGPAGVKLATQRVRQVLQDNQPRYVIRADIRSFYKSMPHHKLVQDIKQHYSDPRVQTMLSNIIKNPVETPRGYKNADSGIALRGPLSQFLSRLYLKPLDDALSKMEVTYLRYQDDILILCNTKRQLNRCWRKMLDILNERRLSLSHKKTRKGEVSSGFHFLGVYYAPTQPESNTTVMPVNDTIMSTQIDQYLCYGGGKMIPTHQQAALQMVPHARTLRKAREQVKSMVTDGASPRHIRKYLARWIQWWNETVDDWSKNKLIQWFCRACFDVAPAAYAAGLLLRQIRKSRIASVGQVHSDDVLTSLRVAA